MLGGARTALNAPPFPQLWAELREGSEPSNQPTTTTIATTSTTTASTTEAATTTAATATASTAADHDAMGQIGQLHREIYRQTAKRSDQPTSKELARIAIKRPKQKFGRSILEGLFYGEEIFWRQE